MKLIRKLAVLAALAALGWGDAPAWGSDPIARPATGACSARGDAGCAAE